MIDVLKALNAYYDVLSLEATDQWNQIRIVGVRGDTLHEEVGYDVEKILQNMLVNTLKRIA